MMRTRRSETTRRVGLLSAFLLLAAALWFVAQRPDAGRAALPARATVEPRLAYYPESPWLEPTEPAPLALPPEPTERPPEPLSDMRPVVLEASGRRVKHRVWVDARYGADPLSLGIDEPAPGYDGDIRPPQGFTPTRDGKLLVLDNAKMRLVWYAQDGRRERELPLTGLELPADVAVAADGTLVVVDHEGVQTAGTMLYDATGKAKGSFPQFGDGSMTGMYAVGNDIFFTMEGLTTVKAGDTSGTPTDDTPGLYDQDGHIPGHVAPDGRTILNASIHDRDAGQAQVTVIRGEPPQHVFSRLYAVPAPLEAIPFAQADARGLLYVALYHAGKASLACLDAETGDPIELLELPPHTGFNQGTPFRSFSVLPDGGVVYQQLSNVGCTFHVFHCR